MCIAIALFLSGYVRCDLLSSADFRDRLTDELLRTQSPTGGWGYEFDVQTRWGYYPSGSPNIVATGFVIEALHDAGALATVSAALSKWLTEEMVYQDRFIRYVPKSEELIHNGNLLGARALLRVGGPLHIVRAVVDTTLSHQQADGTWRYGESANLRWVDNFHTAYVLSCLADLEEVHPDASSALERGFRAWIDKCFDSKGRPKYYSHSDGPTDMNNLGVSIETLAKFRRRWPECLELLKTTIPHALTFQRADGAFTASNRQPPYMRWNQAQMFRGLAEVTA